MNQADLLQSVAKGFGKYKVMNVHVWFCIIGTLSCVSCQSQGAWLSMCNDFPVSAVNVSDERYLAHILTSEEKATILQLDANRPENAMCESFELPLLGNDVLWAGFVKAEITNDKQIALQGREINGHFLVSEIIPPETPSAVATIAISKYKPMAKARTAPITRASWFWSPASWLQNPQNIFDAQSTLSLTRIYITIPVKDGRVEHPEQLKEFIRLAHQRKLQVWAVLGDPNAVLDQERMRFAALAGAYQAFNTADGQQKIDGIQLDIEPYLLPGYSLNPSTWLQKQAKTVVATHQMAPSLAVDMVLPFWFDPLQGDGAALLAEVEPSIASITVMNYRTDPEQITEFSEKFFNWGEARGKDVYIALESLNVQVEDRRVYRQAESGELWRFDFKEKPVLLLFKQPMQNLSGDKAFRLLYTRPIDGSNTSFFRQPDELTKLLPILEKQFAAWSSFAGMSLHGFEKP